MDVNDTCDSACSQVSFFISLGFWINFTGDRFHAKPEAEEMYRPRLLSQSPRSASSFRRICPFVIVYPVLIGRGKLQALLSQGKKSEPISHLGKPGSDYIGMCVVYTLDAGLFRNSKVLSCGFQGRNQYPLNFKTIINQGLPLRFRQII